MRIVFVQPSREPVTCAIGPVRVGSHADNDIVLGGSGVGAHHLEIDNDGSRGPSLRVLRGAQRIYVNARPVRERALLRHGDVIHVGDGKLLLSSDRAPPEVPAAGGGAAPGTAHAGLRIVSGPGFGRLLTLGAEGGRIAEIAPGCQVSISGGGLLLEAGGTKALVNGWPCARAWLSNGDQIAAGEHRVVVEAPASQRATLPRAAAAADPPVPTAEDRSHAEFWLLIAAAAALAAIIAVLLYVRW
jgi:pSer/pThr/pTyr-binding forkhead associated (FHA) protein